MDLEWLLPEQIEQILRLCDLSSIHDPSLAANILEQHHWNFEVHTPPCRPHSTTSSARTTTKHKTNTKTSSPHSRHDPTNRNPKWKNKTNTDPKKKASNRHHNTTTNSTPPPKTTAHCSPNRMRSTSRWKSHTSPS